MTVFRIADFVAVAALAVVFLMPSGSLTAKAALEGDRVELDRLAALEDARFAEPDSVAHALALGDAYMHAGRPEWALQTTAPFANGDDLHVHLLRATAYAERLQPAPAVHEAQLGEAACDKQGAACDKVARVRLGVVTAPMQALLDAHIDPRTDPRHAREAVGTVLHSTKARDLLQHAPPPPAQK